MDGIMGAGPIGDMGRAVERATANMSPDQKQEYLRQAALNGIDPRVNNIALLQIMSMQLDRLKQPQAQPPQGGTVRQQLNAAVAMKNQQEQEAELRRRLGEEMQRKAMESRMALEQGIGGLDSGTMERAQYAGGGVVALAGGGKPSDAQRVFGFDPTSPESIIGHLAKEREGGVGPYVTEKVSGLQALRKQLGIGEYGEYQQAAEEEARRLQEQAAGYGERAGREDLASYFFNVAAEASKPGATFIGSYAKAAPAYSAARKQTQKEAAAAVDQARAARLKMLQAKELQKQGDYEGFAKQFEEGRKEAIDAGMKIYSAKKQMDIAAIQMAPQMAATKIKNEMAKLDPTDPEYQRLNQKLKDIQFGAAEIRAQSRMNDADKSRLNLAAEKVKAAAKSPFRIPGKSFPELDQAQREYDALYSELKGKGVPEDEIIQNTGIPSSAAPAPAAGGTDRYSGFTATPIR